MVERMEATVYFSSVKGRRFFTKKAAIRAEARVIIARRYPTEKAEYHEGFCSYPGFHWSELPRSEVMLRRLCKIIERSMTDHPAAGGKRD